ncbi:MAG: DUF3179 domain-containing protein [Rhodobacterales bacterium]
MFRFISILCACFCFATAAIAQSARWHAAWPKTDFSKTSIDLSEVLSGGPAKDGIPAILAPKFYPVNADHTLKNKEPVMTVELAGQVPRAYPIRYLIWHEIIDDVVGGMPIAVTFCPLCNSGVVFDRRLKDGRVLTFGVTGKLRNSDMIMYDHETKSWWQQFQGLGIVGELTGVKLRKLPGWMESWGDFKARNPTALVMRPPKFPRNYGQNPYAGYDSGRPFLYRGENPPFGIPPLARVVVVGNRAWPLTRFRKTSEITEAGVRITWKAGTASALDSRNISKGRDVGAIRVRDAKTGKDIVHDVSFAFAFQAFNPQGRWMLGR